MLMKMLFMNALWKDFAKQQEGEISYFMNLFEIMKNFSVRSLMVFIVFCSLLSVEISIKVKQLL